MVCRSTTVVKRRYSSGIITNSETRSDKIHQSTKTKKTMKWYNMNTDKPKIGQYVLIENPSGDPYEVSHYSGFYMPSIPGELAPEWWSPVFDRNGDPVMTKVYKTPKQVFELSEEDFKKVQMGCSPAPIMLLFRGKGADVHKIAVEIWDEIAERMNFDPSTMEPIEGETRKFAACAGFRNHNEESGIRRWDMDIKPFREAGGVR
jgi:hypothetical protein